MTSWLISFAATFLALVVRGYIADLQRQRDLKAQGAAEERRRYEQQNKEADERAAQVGPANRDDTLRKLDGGVF